MLTTLLKYKDEANIDIDHINNDGQTSLMIASEKKNLHYVKLLLSLN
jgi:ankyrin repeat protein